MSYLDLLYDGQLWVAERMLEENPEDRPELAAYRHSLKWRLWVWVDTTLQFHGQRRQLELEHTNIFDAIVLEAREICPNWRELDAMGVTKGAEVEFQHLRAERRRTERRDRRAEELERAWREREEEERRRAEQEEEDLAERYNFNNSPAPGAQNDAFPDFSPTNAKEVVRAAMKPADRQRINNESTCRICLSGEERRCVELACGHYFHKRCAKKWLRKKMTCPLCNSPC